MYIVLEKPADYDGWPVNGNVNDVYFGPFEDKDACFEWIVPRMSRQHHTILEVKDPT